MEQKGGSEDDDSGACTLETIALVRIKVDEHPGQCRSHRSLRSKAGSLSKDCKSIGSSSDDMKSVNRNYKEWLKNAKKCMDRMCQFNAKSHLENFLVTSSGAFSEERRNLNRKCQTPTNFPVKYYNETSNDRTETYEESLASSLLRYMKSSRYSKPNLVEAFCRDIDSFNLAYEKANWVWRPSEDCKPVPKGSCATLYDSRNCYGGWNLTIPAGTQRRFKYFSSDWTYRNDMDTVAVAPHCTFTGFSGSSFDGTRMTVSAGMTERWVVLKNETMYQGMHEDIESVTCVCRN